MVIRFKERVIIVQSKHSPLEKVSLINRWSLSGFLFILQISFLMAQMTQPSAHYTAAFIQVEMITGNEAEASKTHY